MQFDIARHLRQAALAVKEAGRHLVARPVLRQAFERVKAMHRDARLLLGDERHRAAFIDAELGKDTIDRGQRQRVAHQVARRVKGDRIRHVLCDEVERFRMGALKQAVVRVRTGISHWDLRHHRGLLDEMLETVVGDEHGLSPKVAVGPD